MVLATFEHPKSPNNVLKLPSVRNQAAGGEDGMVIVGIFKISEILKNITKDSYISYII